jgi:leucyl aminopeptidase
MNVVFSAHKIPASGTLFVGVFDKNVLSPSAKEVNKKTGDLLEKVLKSSHFSGKRGEMLAIPEPAGLSVQRLILFGMGAEKEIRASDAMEIGAHISMEIRKYPETDVTILLESLHGEHLNNEKLAAVMGTGFLLRSYEFQKYKTQLKDKDKFHVKKLTFGVDSPKAAEKIFEEEEALVKAVTFARDIMSEPPNVIHPETLAERLQALSKIGLKVEVLGEKEMKKLGMNALLGVGQGSDKESKLVIMKWSGGDSKEAPLAFVGKGVTFDTGGISIKPSAKMDEMKYDMGGSAAVAGLMYVLAARKAKVNAVGVVGLVENMPDGNAQRPGDIVTSMSGQTIEILNTDAEGRLVLADALWYTQGKFKPKLMIDLATLTGAITVSLGSKFAGLFSNDEGLVQKLREAGEESKEQVWQLPLDDRYDRNIDSRVADMQNIGAHGAGSITAAQFLQRFVNKVPWAHLDIAGTAWTDEPNMFSGKNPTGFGVRLLNTFIHKFYEK